MEIEYIAVEALEEGVTIMGMTRGKSTNIHHTEKLNKGEIWLCQFTEDTSAMKIRGKAKIYTKYGPINAGEALNKK